MAISCHFGNFQSSFGIYYSDDGQKLQPWFYESELPPKTNRHHSFLHAVRKSTSEVKQLERESIREREKRWIYQVYILHRVLKKYLRANLAVFFTKN